MEYNREDAFSLDRLINRANAAEGTSLPPQQRGDSRVPQISGLRVSPLGNSQYIVSWIEPEGFDGKIVQYDIFAKDLSNSGNFIECGSSAKSPATVTVPSSGGSRLVFAVQTQLFGGFVSPPGTGVTACVVVPPTVQTLTSGPYTIGITGTTLLADTSAGNLTIYLPPAPKNGDTAQIKKIAAANTLTIDGNGHAIDGAATIAVVTQYISYTLVYNDPEWSIV